MTREEEMRDDEIRNQEKIEQKQFEDSEYWADEVVCSGFFEGYIRGAEWADKHPSEKIIVRIVELVSEWKDKMRFSHYGGDKPIGEIDYIKQHLDNE